MKIVPDFCYNRIGMTICIHMYFKKGNSKWYICF